MSRETLSEASWGEILARDKDRCVAAFNAALGFVDGNGASVVSWINVAATGFLLTAVYCLVMDPIGNWKAFRILLGVGLVLFAVAYPFRGVSGKKRLRNQFRPEVHSHRKSRMRRPNDSDQMSAVQLEQVAKHRVAQIVDQSVAEIGGLKVVHRLPKEDSPDYPDREISHLVYGSVGFLVIESSADRQGVRSLDQTVAHQAWLLRRWGYESNAVVCVAFQEVPAHLLGEGVIEVGASGLRDLIHLWHLEASNRSAKP